MSININHAPCPQRWRAACAAARAAGRPEPSWFSWCTEPRRQSYAIADDFESLAAGDGSMWQV
jgi:hypothetical protein